MASLSVERRYRPNLNEREFNLIRLALTGHLVTDQDKQDAGVLHKSLSDQNTAAERARLPAVRIKGMEGL
jgi:hypothetical protein